LPTGRQLNSHKENSDIKVAILNSRQSLRPLGTDLWIKQTELAVKTAVKNGYTILLSAGMNSWEVTLFLASKYNAKISLHIPLEKGLSEVEIKDYYLSQFQLNSTNIDWKFINIESLKKDKQLYQKQRDEAIIQSSDLIYPISIRPDGNLDNILKDKVIDSKCKIDYLKVKTNYKINFDNMKINSDIDSLLDNYLIHWTRASNSPWLGESLYDFYESILSSSNNYSHDGIGTLINILQEKKLRASSRHLRKGISAVSFSSLKPSMAVDLMKWRARYREMSFEPYGLAIHKDMADKIGVRPVIYGNLEMYQYLEEKDQPYFQSMGTIGDWLPEREYRHLGDVDLSSVPSDAFSVIVFHKDKINRIKSVFEGDINFLFDI